MHVKINVKKDEGASLIFFGIIITKKKDSGFFFWLPIFGTNWIKRLRSFELSITYPLKSVFVCFCLSRTRWNSHIRFSGGESSWITYLNKVYDWFEERLEIQAIADDITSKYVPPHVNIFYCLGGITLTCFLVQVATGFAMTFYYRPTVTEAFSSVQYIMTETNFGWLIRSVHRWSASMMVLMMILHVFRVYLTGGFKKPRELTWVTGVVLAVLTASFGVTGYSLPRDQIGYWAVKIVTGVPEAIPVIGSPLVELWRGSASVGQSTLTRFYSLHTFVLPLLTAVFMLMHFPMIRKQGISGPL